jgi:hypothetical protein
MLKIIGLCSLFLSVNVYSHGTNSKGPHSGNISMPANYHIELAYKNNIKIYFLDINLKDMLVRDTYLKVFLINKTSKDELNCLKNNKTNYYECKIPKNMNDILRIEVESSISKNKKYKSVYKMPLDF